MARTAGKVESLQDTLSVLTAAVTRGSAAFGSGKHIFKSSDARAETTTMLADIQTAKGIEADKLKFEPSLQLDDETRKIYDQTLEHSVSPEFSEERPL